MEESNQEYRWVDVYIVYNEDEEEEEEKRR